MFHIVRCLDIFLICGTSIIIITTTSHPHYLNSCQLVDFIKQVTSSFNILSFFFLSVVCSCIVLYIPMSFRKISKHLSKNLFIYWELPVLVTEDQVTANLIPSCCPQHYQNLKGSNSSSELSLRQFPNALIIMSTALIFRVISQARSWYFSIFHLVVQCWKDNMNSLFQQFSHACKVSIFKVAIFSLSR